MSFDRDEALRRAMEVFWTVGYEAATLEELQAAMGGLSPPSFYNTFGSKEALFREVIELYSSTVNCRPAQALVEQPTARAAIETMLREAVEAFTQPGSPRGCLLGRGMMTSSRASESLQSDLRALCLESTDHVKRRLERAVAEGDLPKGIDLTAIASFYATVAQGLDARARYGASRKALLAAVDGAMAAWPALTARPRKGRAAPRPSPHR